MNDASVSRWTAIAGFATVITALIAIPLFGALSPPTESDSAQNVAKFFGDNRTELAALVYLVAISIGFNLIFFIGLRDALRRRAPDYQTLASVGAIAGIVSLAIAYVAFGFLLQLVYREGAGNADTQKTLFDIYLLTSINMVAVPAAIAVGATSVVVLRSGAFASWLGWYGLAVTVASLIVMGSLGRDGFFAPSVIGGYVVPLMFFVWMLAFSVLLWRGEPKAS